MKGDSSMKNKIRRTCAAVMTVVGLGLPVLTAGPSTPPSADEVMSWYIEATGGKAAYGNIQNRVSKATLEITGAGISFNLTSYSVRPNKLLVIMESDAMGKIESGCDGETAWENSMMTGPRIKEGEERATTLRESVFDRLIQYKELYQKAEFAGEENVEGTSCYKVVLTPETGHPQTLFFDRESRLLIRMDTTIDSPMGSIPSVSYLSDYKEVDGILVAHTVSVDVMGQRREVITHSVEHNVDLPEDLFDLPEEIRELIKN